MTKTQGRKWELTEVVMSPQFLSAGEISLLLRKSLKWVYQNANNLPGSFKLGGTWYFDKETLISSLKALAKKPKAPIREAGGSKNRHNLL